MRKFKCRFCDHEVKTGSSYQAHALLRHHLELAHPTDFTVLKAGEDHIMRLRSQLGDKFGWALRPRNMNP